MHTQTHMQADRRQSEDESQEQEEDQVAFFATFHLCGCHGFISDGNRA